MNGKQIQVTLKDGEQVKCSKCGNPHFLSTVSFFRFSKLLTGAPKDSYQPIEVFLCGKCGEVLQEVLPNDMKTPTETENIIEVDFTPKPKPA